MSKDSVVNRFSEWLGIVFVLLMQLALIGPYFFGLGFSFYRFGELDGIISLAVPPYAWYRGISYLWVQPKWKEDWSNRTGNLAFHIINTPSPNPEVEYALKQYKNHVQKWLKKVPEKERDQLLEQSEELSSALSAYYHELFSQITISGTIENDLIESPSIQRHVKHFRSERGFMEVWEEFLTRQRYQIKVLKKKIDIGASNMGVDEFRLKMLDFMDLQGAAGFKFAEEQRNEQIEKLFHQ
jgi:hypothetical protein